MGKRGSFLRGLLTGSVVGGALALLYAPFSGQKAREIVKEKIDDLKTDEGVGGVLEKGKEILGEGLDRLKDAFQEGIRASEAKRRELEGEDLSSKAPRSGAKEEEKK